MDRAAPTTPRRSRPGRCPRRDWRPSRDPGAHRLVHARGKRPPRAARRRPRDRRGRAVPGRSGRRARASRRCSARSTAWCPTSPAATSSAASSSAVATRASTSPATWPRRVGYVGQDPLAGFVTDTVEEELAYAMEQLGLPPDVMRKRVEETLDLLGIAELRGRPLRTLSGGQQQRVAIGSVLTAHPRVLVLDEPTSALDPTAAEDVLAAVHAARARPRRHGRARRASPRASGAPLRPRRAADATAPSLDGSPEDVLVQTPLAPPVVQLGAVAGLGRRPRCRCATRAGTRVPLREPWPRESAPTQRPRLGDRRRTARSGARGLTVVYGAHDRGARGRPRPPRRRGRRVDGTQRRRASRRCSGRCRARALG